MNISIVAFRRNVMEIWTALHLNLQCGRTTCPFRERYSNFTIFGQRFPHADLESFVVDGLVEDFPMLIWKVFKVVNGSIKDVPMEMTTHPIRTTSVLFLCVNDQTNSLARWKRCYLINKYA